MISIQRPHPWLGLLGWTLIVFVAAAAAALGSVDAPTFYARLDRPAWAPSAGIFGPVWTALYSMMAVAAWLVWRAPAGRHRTIGLALFALQLVLNALWSSLFFSFRSGEGALFDIVVLLGVLLATLVAFWRVRALSGALLVPYAAWVMFATALTWSAWQRNPAML
jgi:tryptophan-rich sensory protein